MRDIKFRVWDKLTKHMHICGEDVHDTISFEIETNKAYYYNLQNGCGSLRENSDYVLMQYTGLKDKNGKEIYEGDIVKSYYYIPNEDGTEGERYVVKLINYDKTLCKYNIDMFENLEIIGNMWDIPELLEEGE